MRRILYIFCLLLLTSNCYAQYDNICDVAYSDFNKLINAFLQNPTEKNRNDQIYCLLDELQKAINEIHVSREERYQLNSLQADINVFKDFISPISNKYPSHISDNNLTRLQVIFGDYFSQKLLNVDCPSDEVQFLEVRVGNLIMCYFHCISRKVSSGLRISFQAISNNIITSGEYGAMKNEYVPILHNAGEDYARVFSAKITERF
ncbi:MAG: hypothetical protein J6J09_01770 [Phocaeicola sp.]|nr:hypothetical protein [Phocaeicola sp.]